MRAMRSHMSVLAAGLLGLTAATASAQPGNYSVEPGTYITVSSPAFTGRIDFTALVSDGNVIGQSAINTYWFVKPDDAHVVVHVGNGKSVLFLELSGNKAAYTFPTDASQAIGRTTDLSVSIVDKNGDIRQLSSAANARVTVHVVERDAVHLKLTFDGAMLAGSSKTPVPVEGGIALRKKTADLEHLPNTYAGCDNTIFDRISPNFDLGQWRSSTGCEVSLRHKLIAAIDASLQPVYRYMKSQTWTCDPIKDTPSDRARRGREHEPFRLAAFQGAAMRGACQPNPAAISQAVPLDRITALSTRLASLPLDPPPADRARVEKERQEIQDELSGIGKRLNEKQALALEVTVNEPSSPDRPIAMTGGTIEKVGATEYVVANTGSAASGFSEVGGTYLLLGAWQPPERSGDRVTLRPALTAGAPLTVQAILIRIGAGPDLARQAMQHLDVRALAAMLPMAP
jgi:hypothetical protein